MSDLLGIPIPPDETNPAELQPGGPVFTPTPPVFPEPPQPKPFIREPVAPDTTALPSLDRLALLLVILALVAIAKAFTDLMNWLFRTMLGPLWPRTGRKQLSSQALTQKLSNTLGTFGSGVDAEIGVSFTRMAETAGTLSRFALESAATIQAAALQLARLEGHAATADHGQAQLRQSQRQTKAQLRQTAATLHAQLAAQAETTVQLQTQVHRLTEHVHHVLEPELDGMRHAIPALEKGAATAWGEITRHGEALGLAAMTGTVAVALGRLGGGWIRCEANQALGKANCGSNNSLVRKLLAGTLDVLALSDICDLSAAVVAVGQTLRPELEAFVSVENALIGCHGAEAPPAIPLARVSPTAVFATVSL